MTSNAQACLPSQPGQQCQVASGVRYTVISVSFDDEAGTDEPIYVFQPDSVGKDGRPSKQVVLTATELVALKPELVH